MQSKELRNFFIVIGEEKKIATSHISLYATLFLLWIESNSDEPILITRAQIMKMAKIKGVATFHKCMRELNELRLIKYLPSRNPAIKSSVYLVRNITDNVWVEIR